MRLQLHSCANFLELQATLDGSHNGASSAFSNLVLHMVLSDYQIISLFFRNLVKDCLCLNTCSEFNGVACWLGRREG